MSECLREIPFFQRRYNSWYSGASLPMLVRGEVMNDVCKGA
jgi:hypothetical protein